jgi:SAM-dependent methyltransferase
MTAQQLDQARVDAFGLQLIGIMNGASLALMLSIGHRTGLFDTLAGLPPATSEQIAGAAGLNERYVREWLGAMVAGRIVAYDAATRRYYLPPEHAASLTRAAGPNNMARFMQTVAQVAPVEDQIVRCFREGGGVPYSAYPGFQRLMAEVSDEVQDALLIDRILPLVPGLSERLRAGCDAADLGCGMGHTLNLLAGAFPRSRFTGFDISGEGIASGRAQAARLGLGNARFVEQDIAQLNAPATFDLITAFDAIHDQAHPDIVLKNTAAALRPGGIFTDGGCGRLKRVAGEPRASSWTLPVHHQHTALHDRLAGAGRHGARRGLGRAEGPADARRGWLRPGRGCPHRRRLHEQLLHLPHELKPPCQPWRLPF